MIDSESSNEKRMIDSETSNGKRMIDSETSNEKRMIDSETSNEKRMIDSETSNEKRMMDAETSNEKRIKFRSISTTADPHYALNKVDDMYLPRPRSKSEQKFRAQIEDNEDVNSTLFSFLGAELKRNYALEHDEENYHARREKVYSFMKIPLEVEKFMIYGFFQCADSFMFVYTFLPIRLVLVLWGLITRPFRKVHRTHGLFRPAEICDLLKGSIIIICSYCMTYVDTSIMYHLIKSQSIIKLYIFYNMLEVADRLFSAFGQDVIDALFWTSTEPRDRKREHFGTIPHLCFALIYVFLHSLLVLCQATTLNVAINSSNKALLTIMMSNNFVELKGSVFKKFDKNNLFQVACSDIRERFHLFILLFIVVMQTMKEYAWKEETLWVLIPDCLMVLGCEVVVDWIKHAFITRFNELPVDVYRDYSRSLAYDMAQTRQKNAYSDHSDLVARRMGFIPLPLGVVMIRVVTTCVKFQSVTSFLVALVAYGALFTTCILNNLLILLHACVLMDSHQQAQEQERREDAKSEPCSKDIATSPTRPVKVVSLPTESPSTNLGSTAIFANSTVSMNEVHLNEEMLRVGVVKSLESIGEGGGDTEMYRSEPNIQLLDHTEPTPPQSLLLMDTGAGLKKAESEPNIPSLVEPTTPTS